MSTTAHTLRVKWMGELQAERDALLSAITIPGTHDSGTSDLGRGTASRCQSMTIAEQLAAGVRFLDIRLVPEGNDFRIWHGEFDEGKTGVMFSAVIATCQDFLGQHDGECIVMSIKNEHGTPDGAFAAALQQLYTSTLRQGRTNPSDPADRLFRTATTVPTLGQAKGHVVVFRRYQYVPGNDKCIDGTTGWPNDDKTSSPTGGAVPLMVQDVYKMRYADQGDVKWRDHVLDFLNRATADPGSSGTWWFNFTSTSGGGMPYTYADEINPLFERWLEGQVGSNAVLNRLGTIPMDFPTERMIDALIASNFAPSDRFVEVNDRDYTIRLATDSTRSLTDCHQTHAGGTYYGWSIGAACKHRFETPNAATVRYISPGDIVCLRTMQGDMGGYVYLSAGSQFSLWYEDEKGGDEKWTVERVDSTLSGSIQRGETVRFRSLRQTREHGGASMFLSAESDGYLGTRPNATDGGSFNIGIDWIVE